MVSQDVDRMLITIEGIDGSGKTTIWELLKGDFPQFVFTREPTDSRFGKYVRGEVRKSNNPFFDLFLFMADHALHVRDVIGPAIKDGKIVVCDRYIDSRVAYQGSSLEDVLEDPYGWIRELHSWSIYPDVTILLDIPPEKALERCEGRDSKMKFENIEFLEKVRSAYLRMAEEEDRFIVISANKPLEKVHGEVREEIRGVLFRKS